MERFGIAAEIRPKTKLLPPGPAVAEAVAKGEAEIGFLVMSAGLTNSGIDLVGPLPVEVQSYIDYAGGILTTSKQADAARALITFLSSPGGQSALKAKGFEPR